MKRLHLLLGLMLLSSQLFAIDYFKGTYEEAIKKSKIEQKNVLLYFTAVWCGPCKYMDKYVFNDEEISSYVAKNYIAVKIDIDTEAGKKLAIKYAVKGVPNFFIINGSEEILKHKLGAMKRAQLKDFVGDAQSGNATTTYEKPMSDSVAQVAYDKMKNQKPSFMGKLFFTAGVSRWKPGLKMGFSMSNLQGTGSSGGVIPGYYAGFFYDVIVKRFQFQPGIQFNSRGGNLLGVTNRLNYVEMPLALSYRIGRHNLFNLGRQPLRLNLAPYGAVNLSGTNSNGTGANPIKFKRFDYGVKAGLSFQMGTFEPSFGYDFGMADISSATAYNLHNRSYYLSFAIVVGK